MTKQRKYPSIPDGKKLIFRRFRRDPKTGNQLDARKYGKKAWPILIDDV